MTDDEIESESREIWKQHYADARTWHEGYRNAIARHFYRIAASGADACRDEQAIAGDGYNDACKTCADACRAIGGEA